jgi:hypothetical protein
MRLGVIDIEMLGLGLIDISFGGDTTARRRPDTP